MDKRVELAMGNRQESNRAIVKHISDMLEEHPELRFHQILHALNVVIPIDHQSTLGENKENAMQDLFYEESVKTLERVNKTIKK